MDLSSKTFTIPNTSCRRAGIAATWLPFNKLGVWAWERPPLGPQGPDQPSQYVPCEGTVHQVRQQVVLFHPILRKLVNEANGAFLNLQLILREPNVDKQKELLKASRLYRSIIRACLENLQDESVKASGAEKDELENYITIFYSIECLWHLCEIMFVDSCPGGMVLQQLLDWVRFHFPRHERAAARLLSGELQGIDTRPDYWDTVIGALMQGRVDITRALLRLHSAGDSTPYRRVDALLKAMPMYDVYGGVSITEFHVRWKHWKVEVQTELDSKTFITDRFLQLILKLVIGEEMAWEQLKGSCSAWYELLADWLLYTEPTVKSYELSQYARLWVSRFGGASNIRHLDYVVLAILENDLLKVIKEIQFMSENGWFVAHLTDLLYHCGRLAQLDKKDTMVAERVRETFILDYGTALAEHRSLWQVGLSYLDTCPGRGARRAEHVLSRLPFDTEHRALKIIREAHRRNLPDVVVSVCKIQGMKSLKSGRLGNALSWAIRSQDGTFTSYLADSFLKQYCATGKLANTDLLDNLGSCMLVSDKLIFLGKYCEFHQVYQSQNFHEAANLLIQLVASRITPKYFWLTLLMDALPLLECDEIVLGSGATVTLLQCLEERLGTPGLDPDKVSLIRYAITRNLARALTHEAQLV